MLGHEATIADARARRAREPDRAARAPRVRTGARRTSRCPFDGITLEGYVDLVYRDDDGLVVVDYKTDAVDAETRAERVAHYRIQAAAYALAVAEATGEPVVRGVLCFLDPAGAREVEFAGDDLAAAVGRGPGAASRPSRDDPSAAAAARARPTPEPGRTGPERGLAVCHPGRTREGPQVLPQVRADRSPSAVPRSRVRSRCSAPAARRSPHATTPIGELERHDQRAAGRARSSSTATAT